MQRNGYSIFIYNESIFVLHDVIQLPLCIETIFPQSRSSVCSQDTGPFDPIETHNQRLVQKDTYTGLTTKSVQPTYPSSSIPVQNVLYRGNDVTGRRILWVPSTELKNYMWYNKIEIKIDRKIVWSWKTNMRCEKIYQRMKVVYNDINSVPLGSKRPPVTRHAGYIPFCFTLFIGLYSNM